MDQMAADIMQMLDAGCERIVLSKPGKAVEYRRVNVFKKAGSYQIEKLTAKQAFHENVNKDVLADRIAQWLSGAFRQLNGFGNGTEYIFLVSKKGKVTFKQKKSALAPKMQPEHNRKKRYLLEEGEAIPPLVDMGVFTAEGKVVSAMYDKFRQINRFLEIIDDAVRTLPPGPLNIIDFGCGKSYLTFVLYYYLTVKCHLTVQMVGLDLKAGVIEKCGQTAKKYGYTGLRFELGDINGYQAPFEVDMVVSLHACDTATDYALYNAIEWGAKLIFSVPCCQHELNGQMESSAFSLMTRYGIIKERFAALATDAIRANLLEYCGYKTQVLEFVDLSHTPKNLLIRAVKKEGKDPAHCRKMLEEVQRMMQEYRLTPTLYQLIGRLKIH
ncbi:MAG: SAM-dependent methyltransferase [Eubacterium sp.]|jgi:SAM-dependent methyltransferase|nr:SAM-dependent methyltransferase [Eubacterium sp.]